MRLDFVRHSQQSGLNNNWPSSLTATLTYFSLSQKIIMIVSQIKNCLFWTQVKRIIKQVLSHSWWYEMLIAVDWNRRRAGQLYSGNKKYSSSQLPACDCMCPFERMKAIGCKCIWYPQEWAAHYYKIRLRSPLQAFRTLFINSLCTLFVSCLLKQNANG